MTSIVFLVSILLVTSKICDGTIFQLDDLLNSNGLFLNRTLMSEGDSQNDTVLSDQFDVLLDDAVVKVIYEEYKKQYNKTEEPETERRLPIFKYNLKKILAHNLRYRAGHFSFDMGINEFSDMTFDEFKSSFLGYIEDDSLNTQNESNSATEFSAVKVAADYVDWRRHGIVSSIKYQGYCGSCAVFAATACLESSHAFWHKRQIYDLSEQELMDCTTPYGNRGCQGGKFSTTFNYLKEKGQGLEEDYPYEAKEGSCRSDGNSSYAKVINWWKVSPPRNENSLKEAVWNNGPVASAIYINEEWQNYESGIFDAPCAGPRNHAVLVVGYGKEDDKEYWILKNSWGKWGEYGYIRIRRNFGNLCEIATEAVYIKA